MVERREFLKKMFLTLPLFLLPGIVSCVSRKSADKLNEWLIKKGTNRRSISTEWALT